MHSSLVCWNGVCRAAGRILLMGAFLCFSQDVFPFIRTIEIHLHDSLNRQSLSKQENVGMAVLFLKRDWQRQPERMEDRLLRCFGDSLSSATTVSQLYHMCLPFSDITVLPVLCSNRRPLRLAHCQLAEPLLGTQLLATVSQMVGQASFLTMPTRNTRKSKFLVSLVLGIMNSTFQSLGFLYSLSKPRYILSACQHVVMTGDGGEGMESQHLGCRSRKVASLSLAWAT